MDGGPRRGGGAHLGGGDPVRVEVETALKQKTAIIPVLVDGAKMPDPGQLPSEFGNFAYLNAAEVTTGRDFHPQMDRLIAAIDRTNAARPDEATAVYRQDASMARLQLARDAARFVLAPLCLLLAAYYLAVLAFDLNLAYLWLACVAIPLGSGVALSSMTSRRVATAVGFAVGLGAVAVVGMTAAESVATGDPLLPQTRFEWLDNFQFLGAIALSFVGGYFIFKAWPRRRRGRG